ncbi:MAG: type II secretion system protein GspD, partial [Desulfobacteraceae bacterium]|nr:type II secretion system protein GspD [Desulfobacteraceae bacterium]
MKTFLQQSRQRQLGISALPVLIIGICLVFFFFAFSAPAFAQSPGAKESGPVSSADAEQDLKGNEEQRVSLDFNDVDISVFIKFISELTGRNFIVDPRVKGKITVVSPSGISVKEAYRVFESVLDVHGYATVDSGEVTKIIPAPYARTMSIETKLKRETDSEQDKIITQVLNLKYADPNEVKQIFAPLVSKSAVIMSYPPTNMLIVTDVYSNIRRLMRLIDAIDVKGTGREIKAIPVEHADAEKLVKITNSLFNTRQKAQRGQDQGIVAVADTRTNTLIIQAGEQDVKRVHKLVEILDRQMPKGSEKIHVYYLENANAEDLVSVLEALPSKKAGGEQGQKEAPIVSEDVEIAADKSTNSLIIRAEKEDYEVLKSVIAKLDIPKPMVYIECLIMEVSKDKSFRLGAEWIAGGEASYEGREGVYGGGFSGGTMGGDKGYNYALPEYSASSSALLPPGFSLGILGENIE